MNNHICTVNTNQYGVTKYCLIAADDLNTECFGNFCGFWAGERITTSICLIKSFEVSGEHLKDTTKTITSIRNDFCTYENGMEINIMSLRKNRSLKEFIELYKNYIDKGYTLI